MPFGQTTASHKLWIDSLIQNIYRLPLSRFRKKVLTWISNKKPCFFNIKTLLSLSNCIKIGVPSLYTIKNDIQEKQAKNTMHMHKSNTLCCSIVDLLYSIKYSNCAPYRILFCSNKQRHIYGAIIHAESYTYLHE